MSYDSTLSTLDHIDRVRWYMRLMMWALEERARVHDASKLLPPEKKVFDEVTPFLRGLTYNSPEYHASIAHLGPALEHHYAVNSHHPQHFPNGVDGMTLLDIVEMFCDWKAASERHADGSFERSIQVNQERFSLSPQLVSIFENTRLWLESRPPYDAGASAPRRDEEATDAR